MRAPPTATLEGETSKGVISLNDLWKTGVATFDIPDEEKAANKYLQSFWFHSNHMTGSSFFVKSFQLFIPWYESQIKPMEVKVTHEPGENTNYITLSVGWSYGLFCFP